MRISHRKKKVEPKKIFFFNEGVSAPQVLVLDSEGKNMGVMKTGEAIRLARNQGMDLVEINPKITPPVAKIMDYGQFRYRLEKEERLKKAHQHVTEIKGVRLSLRIGAHDLEIRKSQSLKFLDGGDKVKVEIILRGREMQQSYMARGIIQKFIDEINALQPVRVDQTIEKQGNKITAIIAKS